MIPADWIATYDTRPWLRKTDPRARIIIAVVLVALAVAARAPANIALNFACALALFCMTGFSLRHAAYRLIPLLILSVTLVALVPLRIEFSNGLAIEYAASSAGYAFMLGLRTSSAAMIVMSLVGTIEPVSLGHALVHLKMPPRLVQLFLFTARYFDVLRREMMVMHTALLARGFAPLSLFRNIKAASQLAGMLMVRSLNRSERILAAMQCRGYNGNFYMLDHFHFTFRDAALVLVAVVFVTGSVLLEIR